MSNTELSQQREAFAQAIASGLNQSDAYRKCYKVGVTTKPDTINQAASRLMADSKVAARVAELRKPVVEAAQITLKGHLERLSELSTKAEQSNQLSAAIAAEVARGKASGLYVERTELSGSVAVEATLRVDTLSTETLAEIMAARDASKRN